MSIQIYDVDGSPKTEEEKSRPVECSGGHCWHLDKMQHTVANHSDWRCCQCNKMMCRRSRCWPNPGPFIDAVHKQIILGSGYEP